VSDKKTHSHDLFSLKLKFSITRSINAFMQLNYILQLHKLIVKQQQKEITIKPKILY